MSPNCWCRTALAKVIPEGWYVDSQDAITLATSEPEPDVMVIRGQPRDYLEHHPLARELALVVEVSDSSLRHDQGFKKAIYAAAAIPVYWIINLIDRQVEVYTDPTGPADQPDYRQRQDFSGTEQVPVVIAGREVARIPVREFCRKRTEFSIHKCSPRCRSIKRLAIFRPYTRAFLAFVALFVSAAISRLAPSRFFLRALLDESLRIRPNRCLVLLPI